MVWPTSTFKEIQSETNVKELVSRIEELHEQNPMLGHRGCRLGISFPEIYEMQCRAIFEALSDLKKKKQKSAFPEIMIPLVSTESEIRIMRDEINSPYLTGTAFEIPI